MNPALLKVDMGERVGFKKLNVLSKAKQDLTRIPHTGIPAPRKLQDSISPSSCLLKSKSTTKASIRFYAVHCKRGALLPKSGEGGFSPFPRRT